VAVLLLGVGLFLLVGWTLPSNGCPKDAGGAASGELDRGSPSIIGLTILSYRPQPNAAVRVTSLLDFERTRQTLDALPPSVWRSGQRLLVDPGARRCSIIRRPTNRAYVLGTMAARFVSAGPDRDFRTTISQIGDNLRVTIPARRFSSTTSCAVPEEEEAENAEKTMTGSRSRPRV
jgi:hypothetical protein